MTERLKHIPPRILLRGMAASSKATTGHRMFVEGGDGRSAWALRWKDLILAHVNDLGGPELLSEAQISLIRRASAMECELEATEARMSEGQVIDVGQYARLTSLFLDLVGIRRLTKPLDPLSDLAKSLEAYPAKAIDHDLDDGDVEAPCESTRLVFPKGAPPSTMDVLFAFIHFIHASIPFFCCSELEFFIIFSNSAPEAVCNTMNFFIGSSLGLPEIDRP
jgi:hypothetical protein